MPGGARTLIVGLDGATWDLADRFIADGRMPHLARLVEEGVERPQQYLATHDAPVMVEHADKVQSWAPRNL